MWLGSSFACSHNGNIWRYCSHLCTHLRRFNCHIPRLYSMDAHFRVFLLRLVVGLCVSLICLFVFLSSAHLLHSLVGRPFLEFCFLILFIFLQSHIICICFAVRTTEHTHTNTRMHRIHRINVRRKRRLRSHIVLFGGYACMCVCVCMHAVHMYSVRVRAPVCMSVCATLSATLNNFDSHTASHHTHFLCVFLLSFRVYKSGYSVRQRRQTCV